MYLSRLSGCPKSSERDAQSSGILLLGTKSNQQVLSLANTEGGKAQSLFVGQKLLDCCVVGQGVVTESESGTKREQIFNYNLSHCVLANVHLVW
jgi:hypothetical protein